MSALTLGSVRIDPVLDGYLGLAPAMMFPDVDASVWRDYGALDEHGLLPMPHGGYLLRGPGATVLVDLGFALGFEVPPEAGQMYSGGALLDGLAAVGVAPADITDVVITHAHPDHVGWASQDGTAVFPQAAHWCHAADWDLFVEQRTFDYVADQLRPVESVTRKWSGSAAVADWLQLREAPGHTPGSAVGVVDSGGHRAALIGDLAHHLLELANPAWPFDGDIDSVAATGQRRRWFGEFAADGTTVLASHFQDMDPIRITARGGGWSVAPVAECGD